MIQVNMLGKKNIITTARSLINKGKTLKENNWELNENDLTDR